MNTESTRSRVLVSDIPKILEDPARGVISLVGDQGGLSLITGPAQGTGFMAGLMSIETEHGVVYLDADAVQQISEEVTYTEDHPWEVSWQIDSTGSSPEEAAAKIWRDIFGRTAVTPDDACVFTVRDAATGESVRVDLSETADSEQDSDQ
ncbi:hypothetical protein [Arthrobacter koreensis]|uniref:hypothetical protein n=1 Tax=Arthrobacter koreensis TaxID=199136 RepID=UPI0037FDB2C7